MNGKQQGSDSHFPIRELSARTQVNTVTLRAWERRYGLLKPQRSSKGHRLYSEQDVVTIDKVLALVARGVPISKVKPLLKGDMPQSSVQDDMENWRMSISALLSAVASFSVTKLEHLIQQIFSNYPVQICRQRLIEPVSSELAQYDDSGAAFGFFESEMTRYALMRLSAKVGKKNSAPTVILIAGNQAPMWRLVLMALELTDLDFSVHLLSGAFSAAAAVELAGKFAGIDTVFYQDGVLKPQQKILLANALRDKDRLFLCGTAPVLSQFNHSNRVFGDVKACIDGLQKSALINLR